MHMLLGGLDATDTHGLKSAPQSPSKSLPLLSRPAPSGSCQQHPYLDNGSLGLAALLAVGRAKSHHVRLRVARKGLEVTM